MLNELMIIERGARNTIKTTQRHPDVKDGRQMPTLLVGLDHNGQVVFVRPVPHEVTVWTLRDGQHNSFPFVQLRDPLWRISRSPENDAQRALLLEKNNTVRRKSLFDLADDASFDNEALDDWPSAGLLKRLRERRQQLGELEGTNSEVVLATIDRFLCACDQKNREKGFSPLLQQVTERILKELDRSAQDVWLETAIALLIGSFDKKRQKWRCSGALVFEAAGENLSILDPALVSAVSDALRHSHPMREDSDGGTVGVCALTGLREPLLTGNSPQPNLPVLGQTYVFAKNRDILANDRYGRFSTDAMHIGQDTAIRLAAVLEALTSSDRKDITWRGIPGEAPRQSDLLLAFVDGVPNAPVADALAEEDFSEEASGVTSDTEDSVAAFEKRTERMIQLVKAKVGNDLTRTPVQIAVFRKVDPANRKVVCGSALSVAAFHKAAVAWVIGERNVPPWIVLSVLKKGESRPCSLPPPHIAPLGLPAFSKQLYIRGGTEKQEVMGLPVTEAMGLFLSPTDAVQRQAERMLRLVLSRRTILLAGVAHAQHTPQSWDRRRDIMRKFDRNEALRTITVLGVLLCKLSRVKEVYMNEAAFKLGQLFAAADVVHAGYCADIRGGAVPPALLGNQVFSMAQTAPVKALAILCRRWKPYDGWSKKASREPQRADSLVASDNKKDRQRGWDIINALWYARRISPIAAELTHTLNECSVDDSFRAELLLGYIAGMPRPRKEDSRIQEETST